MTKAQVLTKKGKKELNMGVIDGLVAKKKSQKLKSTPTTKVALLNKNNKNDSNASNLLKPISKGEKKQSSNKNKSKIKTNELESNNEDFDSENDSQSFDDSDVSIEVNANKNKGIKMFEGLKTIENFSVEEINEDKANSKMGKEEDSEDNEDEVEDGNEGLKALLEDSIADNDDDDDDFNENNESDEDQDEDISDDNDDEIFNDSNRNVDNKEDEYEKDSDDNNDDGDEDESEDNESIGLKALLDESLVDEEDDDDFNGDVDEDDDDDISNESDEDGENVESVEESKPIKKTIAKDEDKTSNVSIRLTQKEQAELDARTIFVGNVPNDTPVKTIKQLFRSYGEIENVRIRGVVPDDNRMSFKVATITKKMHPKVNSMYVFVVFKDKASVKEALKLNGHKLGNNTLRVDLSNLKNKIRDEKKSVFVGNLPFDVTEDEVRAHFVSCGNIESIRVVRNRMSGLSRGIGYVNFVEEDSVTLALELNDTLLKNCKLRVQIYCPNPKGKKRKQSASKQQSDFKKKFKNNKGKDTMIETNENKRKTQKYSQGNIKREKLNKSESHTSGKTEKINVSFQGQKADIKKKFKINKMDKKKKIMAEKLTFKKNI